MQNQKAMRMPAIAVGAFAMAVALVASLGLAGFAPQQAYASGKKTMYVVTKTVTKYPDGHKAVSNYKYNSKGLLVKETGADYGSDSTLKTKMKYTYNKKTALKKEVYDSDFTSGVITYKSNSKGWVVKASDGPALLASITKYKYNKKGQLVQSDEDGAKTRYSYDKKGNLATITEGSGAKKSVIKFKYDKKNNLVRETIKGQVDTKFKNTYKKKLLKKQVATDTDKSKRTIVYSYKKVSVPKKLVKMVNSQQVSIKCSGVPFATAHK